MKSPARNRLLLPIGIAIGMVFLVLAMRGADLEQIVFSISSANFFIAPIFIICLLTAYWMRAQRWKLLLEPTHSTTASTLFPIVMIGHLANLALPMQMGEIIPAVVVSRRTNTEMVPVVASLLLARIFDLLVVLGFVVYVGLTNRQILAVFKNGGPTLAILYLVLVSLVLSYLIWTPFVVRTVVALSPYLPSMLRRNLINQVKIGAQGLQALKKPMLLAKIVASTMVQWGFICLCVYLSFKAMGIQVPLSAAFLTLAMLALLMFIVPSAPGFIGSIQFAYVLALGQYNVDSVPAFAASIYYHSLMYISVLFIGLVCLRGLGYTFKSLQAEAKNSDDINNSADPDA